MQHGREKLKVNKTKSGFQTDNKSSQEIIANLLILFAIIQPI
ncbi:hypothetical protein Hsw_2171 [Hymenobacter swuensis DY53]|uniref:Uncharacterized protein n=1 Tax=Hymenobacter swuensis DY53 TaxID=1227739 RepID=W8F572_9BACT|nr:hypothetical protein Hsw_2171 [Hymenobacter swuensis DY53]